MSISSNIVFVESIKQTYY